MKKLILLMALSTCFSLNSFADKGWSVVAKLKSGGAAKEVAVNQQVSKIAIACTDGSVVIKSLLVKTDDKNLPFSIGTKLNKDESQQITVGNNVSCTKLVINDEGGGEYEVRIKK